MVMMYAGVGSRKAPNHILMLMHKWAEFSAMEGWGVSTGAADGADQAFARGALYRGGHVHLHLPWSTYNTEWRSGLTGNINTYIYDPAVMHAATDSVHKFHPRADKLTRGPFALHARNYMIITNHMVRHVVCHTPSGGEEGGTGQAIRIANHC
jgi:hypothetical protein